jgi:hypothetical protein
VEAGGNTLRSEFDSRLRSKSLTPGERRLAQCLIQRIGEIGHLSSTGLAKVGQPSVTRFAMAAPGRPPVRPARDAALGGGWGGEVTEMAREDLARTYGGTHD